MVRKGNSDMNVTVHFLVYDVSYFQHYYTLLKVFKHFYFIYFKIKLSCLIGAHRQLRHIRSRVVWNKNGLKEL